MENKKNFIDVTELPGQFMSSIQCRRLYTRYYWTREFCKDKDVLEVACGSGSGLGLINLVAKSLEASDVQKEFVDLCKNTYKNEIKVSQFSAEKLPFEDNVKDVIIMHEALYYLEKPESFVSECKRVLRKGGLVLLSNSNKDIYDFNPSQNSISYHGVVELKELFKTFDFELKFWASEKIPHKSIATNLFRILKYLAVKLNLIPKSMNGKTILKRIFFGKLVKMPSILEDGFKNIDTLEEISSDNINKSHRIIFVKAQLL